MDAVNVLGRTYERAEAEALYFALKEIFEPKIADDVPESVRIFMKIADAAKMEKDPVGELSGVRER